MQKIKITIHSMTTKTNEEIKYARILKVQGCQAIGQSLMLNRLSLNQFMSAIDSGNEVGFR